MGQDRAWQAPPAKRHRSHADRAGGLGREHFGYRVVNHWGGIITTAGAASLRPHDRSPMGLLNPFSRAPRSAPDDSVPAQPLKTDAMLPLLRSWWSFSGEALTDRIFGTEAPCAPAVSAVGSDLGIALVIEG